MLSIPIVPYPLAAFDADVQWGGHLKALVDLRWPESNTLLDIGADPPLLDGTIDFRLTNRISLPWRTEFEAHYESILHAGDVIRKARDIESDFPGAAKAFTILNPNDLDQRRLFDLTSVLDEGNNFVFYHRLDRLNLTILPDWGVVRVGRQALTWGDGFVFNPMDLFNPFSPTDIERDYKVGDDMAFAQLLLEGGTDVQALMVPRRNPVTGDVDENYSSVAGKAHLSRYGFEYDVMAAQHYQDFVGGLGVSGYAKDAAWRINATWTVLDDDAGHDRGYLSFVVNTDFSWIWWQHNFYGFVEYYFNGLGNNDYLEALCDPAVVERIDRGELFVLGKNYLTGQIQAEVHPLFNFFFNVILNTADPSAVVQPWVQWDAMQNLRVVMGGKLAIGADGTEFGGFRVPETSRRVGFPDSVYTRITLFF
ncbi:MAG: hypothetical protein HGJ93_03015 [Desulfosarcina sp.]|nr:hypothetical protein [Desulfosarcina sp.]MBC2764944.1 hypothetical protein [Desulfosarcina sp.]